MSQTMLEKEYEVYSEKYDVHGVIRDYGMVIKLFFSYAGKDIEMGIHRIFGETDTYENLGKSIIESYIANFAPQEDGRKLQLHYWYITEHDTGETTFRVAHGIVTGHQKLLDSEMTHTSSVKAIYIDEDADEAVITTQNSVYHCPLAYCRFKRQDEFPDILPEYEKLKEKYKDAIEYPTIEPGKVLLVLADFCDYYFHSLCYIPEDSQDGERLEYNAHAHIGMFQDSYLIGTKGGEIDLRYFPHYQNIGFYVTITGKRPLYLENIGSTVLYAATPAGLIKLEPGKRKEVKKENAEEKKPILPDGDLYPAGIIE